MATGTPSRGSPSRTRGRIVASLGSVLLALFAVEVGLRYRAARSEHRSLEEAWELAGVTNPEQREETWLIHLLRPSSNDRIVYELRPDLDSVPFKGATVTTNSEGFVGPSRPHDPPRGTVRIVGIGDSIMFGWGVEPEQAYLRVLERALAERFPERRWEVVNTGVPGYNTAMEVETLRARGLAYQPDVVILGMSANDLELPQYILEKQDYLSIRRSYLASFVGSLVKRAVGGESEAQTLVRGASELDPEDVPREYRDMVGIEGFERALDELSAMSREHGFEVVSLELWGGSGVLGKLAASCRERGFVHASASRRIERVRKGGATFLDLHKSDEDPHPSAWVHALAAEALLDAMVAGGVIDRILGDDASSD